MQATSISRLRREFGEERDGRRPMIADVDPS